MARTTRSTRNDAESFTIRHIGNYWFEGTFRSYKFQAQVWDAPSDYGINNGRVSKLWIASMASGLPVQMFNYDRGPDVDKLPKGFAAALVSLIEARIVPSGYDVVDGIRQ